MQGLLLCCDIFKTNILEMGGYRNALLGKERSENPELPQPLNPVEPKVYNVVSTNLLGHTAYKNYAKHSHS